MKITPDDPKLTAYALGELDEAGRAAIEAELEKSPECRQAVEEIRQSAAMLAEEFSTEELPDLTFARQRSIENQLRKPAERTPLFSWQRLLFYGAAASVVVVLGAMLLPTVSKSKRPANEMVSLRENPQRRQPAAEPPVPFSTESPALVGRTKDRAIPLQHEVTIPVAESVPPATQLKREETADMGSVASSQSSEAQLRKNYEAALNFKNSVAQSSSSLDRRAAPGFDQPNPNPQTPAPLVHDRFVESSATIVTANGRGGGGGGGGRLSAGEGFDFASQPPARQDGVKQTAGDRSYSFRETPPVEEMPTPMYRYRVKPTTPDTATYPHLTENSFLTVAQSPLSTFSIDVDTASYANVRRFLNSGRLPPRDAVRIEEMINYFSYRYPQPAGGHPFSVNVEVAGCPWNSEHRLARVGLKGREIAQDKRPPSNFVFLIDVSGSMQPAERLPLIKQALRQLVKRMNENDRVAIVVYANRAGIKLDSTSCANKERILEAIDALDAGGSTNGGDGIQQAYALASEHFIRGGVNRVLLCTDGDFNVGLTDQNQLVRLIQDKAKSGVFLTTLGVGTDNYKDALMQKLADKGNGNYHYLDTLEEAQKVLIDQMNGTLVTIAKDVKIQIEFNPAQVGAYRLIGYEKRLLREQDFNNDRKDAGEIGAGHTVTALYEIVAAGRSTDYPNLDTLKYQSERPSESVRTTGGGELLTVKLRYKQPQGDTGRLIEVPVRDNDRSYGRASEDFKFAAAVASFGMVLRDSEFKGSSSFDGILELAQESKGRDENGHRSEFIQLVRKAAALARYSERY